MSEMDEKLNTLLSDPGSMARIMQLAQQLSGTMGGAEKSAPEPPHPPPAGPADQTGGENTGTGEGEETPTTSEDWRNYPVDPATGYLVSPIDGGLIDPVTGEDIGGADTLGDSPVNNNLLNQQNE